MCFLLFFLSDNIVIQGCDSVFDRPHITISPICISGIHHFVLLTLLLRAFSYTVVKGNTVI